MIMKNLSLLGGWVGWGGGTGSLKAHSPHSDTRRISGAYPNVARGTPEHTTASQGATQERPLRLKTLIFLRMPLMKSMISY